MNNNNNSTPQTEDEIRAELEDRLMHQNLEELLGSPRISGAAHVAAPVEPVTCAPTTNGVSRHRRRLFQVLGVVCPLLILGMVWYFTPPDQATLTTVGSRFDDSSEAPASQTLPSPHYARDEVQYYPAGSDGTLPNMKQRYREHIARNNSEKAKLEQEIHSSNMDDTVEDLVGDADSFLLELPPSAVITRNVNQKNESGQFTPTDANGNGGVPFYEQRGRSLETGGTVAGTNPRRNAPTAHDLSSRHSAFFKEEVGNTPPSVDFDYNIQNPSGQTARNGIKLSEQRVKREQLFEGSQFPDPRIEFKPVEDSDTVDKFKTRPALNPSEGRGPDNSGDNYAPIVENPFQIVTDAPLSTFSIDVDTASYSNIRRILSQNQMLPPPDAVRIEEMVNYFNYTYPAPVGDDPFSMNVDQTECPWQPKHRLVRIGLKGREFPDEERPASNLVFLLDVSGSMSTDNKLPLLKSCLKMMVDYLSENDRVAIVVYAGSSGLVLPSTTGDSKAVIMEALDRLNAGGSTNGGAGIELAYKTAVENFIEGGSNRVILATDGDFNVGTTGQGDLQRLIEEKAKSGVFLTTLGFGYGNLQDNTIELLANKGNGNYAYIDSLREGRKVLIDEMGSTLNTIAKDVKIQIEFNPVKVAAYRLLGYENRVLKDRDFNDDTIDAGEIGAGHTVTALYELIPAGEEPLKPEVDELEFQKPTKPTKAAKDGDMMVVKLRYKQPDGDTSDLLKLAVPDMSNKLNEPSLDLMFASQVASFGMLLRGSKYSGVATYDSVLEIAQSTLGEDPESYRTEFIELVKLAKKYDRRGGRTTGNSGF